jgi:hypothetical protein
MSRTTAKVSMSDSIPKTETNKAINEKKIPQAFINFN